MQWYYSKNGTQLGPVAQADLISKLATGEVAPSDLVWKDGMGDWLPAAQVAELRGSAPAAAQVETPSYGETTAPSPYTAPAASPVSPSYPVAPQATSGKATASMVLGIVAIVFGLCGCYGIVITLTCGILAIVFGNQIKKEIAINPALAADAGKAKAGVIMGWIGIAISVLFTILAFAFGLASGVLQEMNK